MKLVQGVPHTPCQEKEMSETQNFLSATEHVDVLVVGGGNAALCAAITAREQGASVLLVEYSPEYFRGGNSRHTRNIRSIHKEANSFLTGPYLEDECFKDLVFVTKGNTDEEMARFVIQKSEDCVDWMYEHGVRFQPPMRGTLHLGRTNAFFLGGGKALINAYYETCERLGVQVIYDSEVVDLEINDGTFERATIRHGDDSYHVTADAVILASGGYQGNREWLREAWGPKAENILVRGTPYDKGRMLRVMMDNGAQTVGAPDQGHCVAIDGRSPKADGGICTRIDCVPFSIAVNKNCERFYDEGEEVWPKRYAIWGRLVSDQPDQIAYCIIDSKSIDLFMPTVFPPVVAGSIREIAAAFGLDADKLEKTVNEFNAACKRGGAFDPEKLDGLATDGITPQKTNWARPVDTPPFYGYPLRPGITFTYLSLKLDKQARVIQNDGTPFKNIFAAGELTSGNVLGQGYMGGFGMTIGTVFGRIAGKEAVKCVKQQH